MEISESAQIGAEWRLESATDKDPDNGIQWYAIDDESMFELKEEYIENILYCFRKDFTPTEAALLYLECYCWKKIRHNNRANMLNI